MHRVMHPSFFMFNGVGVKTQVRLTLNVSAFWIERKGVLGLKHTRAEVLRFSLFLHLILPRFISKGWCFIGIE